MLNFLTKIIPSKHEKDVKLIRPIVDEINQIYEEYNSLTDEEIKGKTQEFKDLIKERIEDLETEETELRDRLKNEALNTQDASHLHTRLKEISTEIYSIITDTLDEILPAAFATVKQACFRMKEEGYAYEYGGQHGLWDMVPYDVQLIGGIVLHQGKISEMATGEGKTLVAVLPLYLNSLAGKGTHLVTVNDYLAKRDADWMRPVYDYLGVTVGSIQSNMDPEDRKKLYDCDITYGTNNEFGFDYLRDNMVTEPEQMVQRPHWYAIVDEVDSVLIDEARTPLIISGPVGQASDQKFDEMQPRVQRLVDAQNQLVNKIVSEIPKLLESDKKEDRDTAGVGLLRSYRGLPKQKKLGKLLQDANNMRLMKDTELLFLRDQGMKMFEIDDELFYTIDEKNHQVDIREKGRQMLCTSQEDADMFVIPDITSELSQLDGNTELTAKEKQQRTDELNLLYAERSDRIHTVSQLLRAYSLYERDNEYVIQDNKIMIVDEFTGRVLEGRRYSEGLHQAIEAKEKVTVERDTQTLATITLQNYFRLYKRLAGMTGTAETEAGEFEKIYKLDVVVVPTNQDMIRNDEEDLIYRTKREKYNAIIDEIDKLMKAGRAVLVGTVNVEVSEVLSKMLTRKKIRHSVLNAKQHQREAEIVANAGKKGTVTIATNMAGRGTDIKLDHEVRQNGGLAIIGSERHEARRIDRQLRGRAGRQGDPGSSQFFISLEDDLMRLFGGERLTGVMQKLKVPEGEAIQHSIMTKTVERAQKKIEENNFGIRKRLLDYDDVMNQQREVIYTRRRQALSGERMKGEIFDYIDDFAEEWYDEYYPQRDLVGMKNAVRTLLLCEPLITPDEFNNMKLEECIHRIITAADEFYQRKEEALGSEFMSNLEKIAILQTIDEKWREHLRVMDDLKEGIHLRAYGQKDPLLEYKGEAFKLFMELVRDINKESVSLAFKFFPRIAQRQTRTPGTSRRNAQTDAENLPRLRRANVSNNSSLQFQHSSEIPAYLTGQQGQAQGQQAEDVVAIKTFKKTEKSVGRNEPCPCGSGKKYKNCHGQME